MDSASKKSESIRELGRTIQFQRKQLGLSQTELAQLVGVSLNFVSQIEAGKATARIGLVFDLLQALGLQLVLEFGKNRLVSRVGSRLPSREEKLKKPKSTPRGKAAP